uniref:Apolipoprotein M n=1 Tax=Gasterosteus aculeatus aculeatus TaxID=481459 RepID=G3P718_GASAC
MWVQCCLALLALSFVTASSDPGCQELLKPQEDRSKIYGKWIFHAGTSDNEELLKELRTLNNMTLRWGDKKDGKCHGGGIHFTFAENITTVTFHLNASDHEHVGKHLVTCADCILWTDTKVSTGDGRNGRNIYIFTKTGKLDLPDMEVFKKQAACLNFPPEFHFGESTES